MATSHSTSTRKSKTGDDLFSKVQSETTIYSFSTLDLASKEFDLPVLEKLFNAGIIGDRLHGQLKLAFQEALANALEHGNLELSSGWREEVSEDGTDRFSREKASRMAQSKYCERRVDVKSNYDTKELKISIKDEGPGFSPPDLKKLQPPQPGTELNSFGRGLPILAAVLDDIYFNVSGNEITLVKKLR